MRWIQQEQLAWEISPIGKNFVLEDAENNEKCLRRPCLTLLPFGFTPERRSVGTFCGLSRNSSLRKILS